MVDRLTKPANMELNYNAKKLKYETREQVGKKYLEWKMITYTANAKLKGLKFLTAGIFVSGILVSPLLLLLLILLIPKVLSAQFYWGDMVDEENKYLSKHVLRVDKPGGDLID
jgi:hypothetical protein